MKKNIIAVVAIVVAFVAGMEFESWYYNTDDLFRANKEKAILIDAYDAYNRDCEILLDSIAAQDDSFMDVIGETDTYLDYCVSREIVDSLIWRYNK